MAELPVPGVRGLDHTADLGLEVEAPTLEELLARAALAMEWLLREVSAGGGGTTDAQAVGDPDAETRTLEVEARDAPALLRRFLRDLLLTLEVEGLALTDVHVEEADAARGGAARARARISLTPSPTPPVREIKGVTWHGLAAERRNGGWWGRVVFDV